jgi:hypothetical protein
LELRATLDEDHIVDIHEAEPMRVRLRDSSEEIGRLIEAISDLRTRVSDENALKSELITAKVKAGRVVRSERILRQVEFKECPCCGTKVLPNRFTNTNRCYLCGSEPIPESEQSSLELELLRQNLNSRIDELTESIERHERELLRLEQQLEQEEDRKKELDGELVRVLKQYDSTFVAKVRAVDSEIARFRERLRSLRRLAKLPESVASLEREAAQVQQQIEKLKTDLQMERKKLVSADKRIDEIAQTLRTIMIDVGFPGFYNDDDAVLDPRRWIPAVVHNDESWTFYDAGSAGKKTLFNVCYALAVHYVAAVHSMPLPRFLIIDSPTKNITEHEDPTLVSALYRTLYRIASEVRGAVQFVLIDATLVSPEDSDIKFADKRFDNGKNGLPSPLIPYYRGP